MRALMNYSLRIVTVAGERRIDNRPAARKSKRIVASSWSPNLNGSASSVCLLWGPPVFDTKGFMASTIALLPEQLLLTIVISPAHNLMPGISRTYLSAAPNSS